MDGIDFIAAMDLNNDDRRRVEALVVGEMVHGKDAQYGLPWTARRDS